jgi:hypothetical protein
MLSTVYPRRLDAPTIRTREHQLKNAVSTRNALAKVMGIVIWVTGVLLAVSLCHVSRAQSAPQAVRQTGLVSSASGAVSQVPGPFKVRP